MWTEDIFGVKKPIIAMLHLLPLPGDPSYDEAGGIEKVLNRAMHDLEALQNGGVDGVLISNEFSLPYQRSVDTQVVASMARIIGQMKDKIKIPYGVDDLGLWEFNYGEIVRHRKAVGAMGVKALFNIVPEAAAYLAERDIVSIAKSTVFNCKPDGLCVSGLTAGASTDSQTLRKVKDAVGENLVFANTGVRLENVEEQLSIADGAVIGTTFKRDGQFYNEVDEARVKKFMEKVKELRK